MIVIVAWTPCLVLAATAYAAILRPKLEYRKELQTKVARSKEQYTRALEAAKEKDRGLLAEQVASLHRRTADFVVALEDAPDLAFKISELAGQARLESFGMRPANRSGPDATITCERIVEKHIDVSFSAGFPRFAAFLNTLERYHPAIFVETFTISRPLEADWVPERDASHSRSRSQPQANMELGVLVERPRGE